MTHKFSFPSFTFTPVSRIPAHKSLEAHIISLSIKCNVSNEVHQSTQVQKYFV